MSGGPHPIPTAAAVMFSHFVALSVMPTLPHISTLRKS